MIPTLFADKGALAELCRRHRIARLVLFGSTLRGTNQPDSDVDLLVQFIPEAEIGFVEMGEIEIELSALLGGKKVDLCTKSDLSGYFRDEVERMTAVLYEA